MGVAIVGLAVGGIAALDSGHSVSMEQRIADGLADEISRIASAGEWTVFVLEVDDYLPTGEWSIELTNDTVAVVHGTSSCRAAIGVPVIVDSGLILATSHDSLVIEHFAEGERGLMVHVTKAVDIPLTASTNFLQSAMLL